MRIETAAFIQDQFPGSKWANPSSSRHQQASDVLADYAHEDIVDACRSMRASLSRTHCTAEELVGEIKRNQRKAAIRAKADQEGYNPYEVEQHRIAMRNAVENAPADEVRRAVSHARSVGSLAGEPLPADRSKWSSYAVGVVWAALNRVDV